MAKKLSAMLRAEFDCPREIVVPIHVPDLPKSRHHKAKLCARRLAIILQALEEGYTMESAIQAAGVVSSTVYNKWLHRPEIAEAVTKAKEAGKEARSYRTWLHHPFRGFRPPGAKQTGFVNQHHLRRWKR